MYREYLDGAISYGELVETAAIIWTAISEPDDASEEHPWDAESIRKMHEVLNPDGFRPRLNDETERRLAGLAWFVDTERAESVSEWDQESIRKMREPLYNSIRPLLNAVALMRG